MGVIYSLGEGIRLGVFHVHLLDKHLQNAKSRVQASVVAQTVKNLPAAQEPQGRPLGWKDPLEKGTATGENGRVS